MTVKVRSDFTLSMEPATIQPGILGSDGVRYGAIADIDLYAMFNWETENGEPVDILVEYQEMLKRYNKNVSAVDPLKDPTSEERKARVARMAEHFAQTGEVKYET